LILAPYSFSDAWIFIYFFFHFHRQRKPNTNAEYLCWKETLLRVRMPATWTVKQVAGQWQYNGMYDVVRHKNRGYKPPSESLKWWHEIWACAQIYLRHVTHMYLICVGLFHDVNLHSDYWKKYYKRS
jgi:hypothetical protein